MYNYTYRITHIEDKKHYYGVRSSKIHPTEDLGIKYFSSSTDKEFIKDQKNNPHLYKYKIIRTFNTRENAIELEIKLHSKFDVGVNESFYNKAKQTSTGFDTTGISTIISEEQKEYLRKINTGKKHTEKTKQKIREINTGRKHTEETKKKISENCWFRTEDGRKMISKMKKGKKLTKEHKEKIRESNKGKKRSLETKQKIKDINLGRKHTEETKRKISNTLVGKKVSNETRMKMSNSHKGSNSNSAIKVNIFDSFGNLMFECHGNFNKICDENDLPLASLKSSYKNEGKLIFQSKVSTAQVKDKSIIEKYKGWYALKV